MKNIFKRLFRVYAHMYHSHIEKIIALGAEPHLNTCFKHFMYFVLEFSLVERKELEPLAEICKVKAQHDCLAVVYVVFLCSLRDCDILILFLGAGT